MFTTLLIWLIIAIIQNVGSVPLQSSKQSLPARKEDNSSLYQRMLKIRNSDQIILRLLTIVFIVAILVFFILICVCTMYWCVSSVLHFSTQVSTNQSRLYGFCWGRLFSRRFRGGTRIKHIEKDLPPAYEVVLAYEEDHPTVARVAMDEDEEQPPSYTDIMLNEKFGAR